jgi:hypothetical protein
MASLDLNELLNNSIANVVAEGKNEDQQETETNESADLNVDLEAAGDEVATAATSGLALDLESVQDQIDLDLDESILENIKGAIGAGVGTYAVLGAREESRIEEASAE